MEARNRSLERWFPRVETGQVLLPRFQRHEAWTHKEVGALLESVLRELPTGAALTLAVGDEELFFSRPIVGAPKPTERVTEHLLDGQQRLTALWRSLHDDYPDRTYLVGRQTDEEGEEQLVVKGEPRYDRKGQRFPLWVDDPAQCWSRGWIPVRLLNPQTAEDEIDDWLDAATEGADLRTVDRLIGDYRKRVATANLPFLELPIGTSRDTALDVFIKMNTSSIKLTAFDIVVAQYEAANEASLHDELVALAEAVPRVAAYREPQDLLLDVAALREDRPPTQASYRQLDLLQLSDDFDAITDGVRFAVEVLENEGIFDAERLPTVAVLPVLGALHPHMPTAGDERGNATAVVRSFIWSAFTTSRYESSAGTRALQDLRGLRAALAGSSNAAPIFDVDEYHLPEVTELMSAGWPKTRETLARAITCASLRRGAHDLADGAPASAGNLLQREYHHLFPDDYLRKAGLERASTYKSLNCALITWFTNRRIGAKAPLDYMRDRIEKADLGEDEVRRRLESHLIPWDQLIDDSGEIAEQYERFLVARAELVSDYIGRLCRGEEPNP